MRDVMSFHKLYYKKSEKQYQDHFILKHVKIFNCKRRRPGQSKNLDNPKCYDSKLRTTKYFVRNVDKEEIPVCSETFKNILQVSRPRINNVTAQFHVKGFIEDRRGGFKKHAIYQPKNECVMKFINSLKCIESHYCRGGNQRKYLSSSLNIKRLWKIYSSEPTNLPVKLSYFRSIFNNKYNLGFGTPQTDVCSLCIELSEKLKREDDPAKKNVLITEKRVHKLKYKAFYDKLKDPNPNTLILSFDCQKNLPLPKVPDQSTYYSRQVYVHNFTVVKGNSKSELGQDNVTAYCWTENEYCKDSNLIASCLLDTLETTDMTGYSTLRLVSDGCSGQNKNSTLMTMVSTWLVSQNANQSIKEVEIVFPVTGHSFLPADRVFGNIEKELKRKEVLVNPKEVYDIIKKYAKIKLVGTDVKVYDFKKAKETIIKEVQKWHFQISKIKRVYINRIGNNCTVRGEIAYKSDIGSYKKITRVGKTMKHFVPEEVLKKNELNANKKKDVDKLLKKHYGDLWRDMPELEFYKFVVDHSNCQGDLQDDLCEQQERDLTLIV